MATEQELQKQLDTAYDTINRLVVLAREMRKRQNEYFRSNADMKKVVIKYAKTAESDFDNYCKMLVKHGFGVDDQPKQQNLL